ncbi:hypothetical protein DID73_01410 [Candidatus Marinamargulisbacteria bacterium SCGC AG-343-K17]|nr:hypothetical protein DID73_01410 [Candidatus Marinamargulisbacteria bacterium SCGC AG-343-K17]
METNIFVTGATGCIGHYALKELKRAFPGAHLHIMVRDIDRFKMDIPSWSNLTIHMGGMDDIGQYKEVLKTVDYVVHIATVWGYDLDVNIRINRDRTLEMFDYCDPNRLKKIIYFSTASILTDGNQLSSAAETEGTPYVKSKLEAYKAIKESSWADKVITLFPTMVLGGADDAPYSHISQGLLDIRKHLKWAKWLHLNGAFHFLHAEDIAKMISIGMTQDVPQEMVMGNPKMTFNDAILEMAEYIGMKPSIQIYLSPLLIRVLLFIFKKRVDSWGAHCAKHPYFEYDVYAPYHFGEELSFSSLTAVLKSMEKND